MKQLMWLLLGSVIISFMACDPDNPNPNKKTTVNLNLKAQFDGEPFVMGEFYDYDNGQKIQLSTVSFYISDVKLIDGTNEVTLLDIAEIDLYDNHRDAASAAIGETITIDDVPVGEYATLQIGLGVSAALNHQDPSNFEITHPLGNTGNYWSWRETYIFAKFEGQLDTAGNTQQNDIYFTYHPGEDAYYRTVTLNKSIILEKKEEATISLSFDLKKVFENPNGGYLDIMNNNQSHAGPDDSWIVEQIMDKMVEAITVN